MDLGEKLEILADSAKYDVACTSSGVDRPGQHGSLGSYTAQRLARGVDDIPFAVDLTGFRHCGRHSFRPPKFVACI